MQNSVRTTKTRAKVKGVGLALAGEDEPHGKGRLTQHQKRHD